MNKQSGTSKASADRLVKTIRRKTRQTYSAEEKIRIVLAGLRGEESISALCRREGISEVSVRRHCPAASGECSIVSTMDSGHYGALDGASNEAALDGRGEAVDLFPDDGAGHIGCPGGTTICDECEPDFQVAA